MTCEQCTFLQESVVDFSQTSSLDIPQWLQSNGNPTPAEFLEREQLRDGFPSWMSGKEMSETLTHPNMPDEWTAFMQDSLVKTLALLENKQELLREPDQVFTEKSCELLAQLDPTNSTWKMSPQLKATDLKRYSKTWPSWGMTVGGCAYEHPMSGRTITATDGFAFVATPTTKANQLMPSMMKHPGCVNLAKLMLPTPTAHNAKEGGYPAEGTRNTPSLAWVIGGKINPQFTEWMMGFPLDFTALKQSETRKSRSKRQSRTDYSKDDLPEWLRTC